MEYVRHSGKWGEHTLFVQDRGQHGKLECGVSVWLFQDIIFADMPI